MLKLSRRVSSATIRLGSLSPAAKGDVNRCVVERQPHLRLLAGRRSVVGFGLEEVGDRRDLSVHRLVDHTIDLNGHAQAMHADRPSPRRFARQHGCRLAIAGRIRRSLRCDGLRRGVGRDADEDQNQDQGPDEGYRLNESER